MHELEEKMDIGKPAFDILLNQIEAHNMGLHTDRHMKEWATDMYLKRVQKEVVELDVVEEVLHVVDFENT